jgi:heme-binding protein
MQKIGLIAFVMLIGIQLIQPARNSNGQVPSTEIFSIIPTNAKVQVLVKTACYDCHSNNTNYPWYANIQPMGWLLASHIKDGKADLNFSDFGGYSERRQQSKLKSIASQVRDDVMPLWSYSLLHQKARLTSEQKSMIIAWALNARDSLAENKLK